MLNGEFRIVNFTLDTLMSATLSGEWQMMMEKYGNVVKVGDGAVEEYILRIAGGRARRRKKMPPVKIY